MTGTILNAAAILLGAIAGLTARMQLTLVNQTVLKVFLGAFTVYVGLGATWRAVDGNFLHILKQLSIVLLSLTLGNLTGKLLRFQKSLNRLGQYAKRTITGVQPGSAHRFNDGFVVGSILFCAAPLAVLGPLQDGLTDDCKPLVVKAVMDGLATMAFVTMFGWSVLLSIIPVVAWQGTLTLLARGMQPWLANHSLVDPINATAGLLVFCVALVILEVKKISLADYLPSLVYAPLLAWLWR